MLHVGFEEEVQRSLERDDLAGVVVSVDSVSGDEASRELVEAVEAEDHEGFGRGECRTDSQSRSRPAVRAVVEAAVVVTRRRPEGLPCAARDLRVAGLNLSDGCCVPAKLVELGGERPGPPDERDELALLSVWVSAAANASVGHG
jgi:hypothetical protein